MNELLMAVGGGAHLALLDPEPADDLSWRDDALCRQVDPDLFFPDTTGGLAQANTAKKVCLQCPVQAVCLEYALEHDVRYGVWGARSEKERRLLRRTRRAAS